MEEQGWPLKAWLAADKHPLSHNALKGMIAGAEEALAYIGVQVSVGYLVCDAGAKMWCEKQCFVKEKLARRVAADAVSKCFC